MALHVAIVFMAASLTLAPAHAGQVGATYSVSNCNAGQPGSFNVGDSFDHTFFYSALSAHMTAAQNWSNANIVDPTDITVLYPGFVNSQTDVVVYDLNYSNFCGLTWHPSGASGLAVCITLNSVGECEKFEVRYDNSYVDGVSTTMQRAYACHETGHTLGLDHNGGDCMGPGEFNSYSAGDLEGINNWFDHFDLFPGQHLFGGQSITSTNDTYRLVMQGDGNLVMYYRNTSNGGIYSPFWSTATNGWYGAYAAMQTDGNFVVYHGSTPLWSTATNGWNGAFLRMQTDRNLVIYQGGVARWASGTNV